MTTAQLPRAAGQPAEPRLDDDPSVRLAPAGLTLLGLFVLACLAASGIRRP